MTAITQPLRDEHKELLPHIEALSAAADLVGQAPAEVVREKAQASYDFLAHHLLRHAGAEEAALYPVVARLMGAPAATATMSRDHVEVERLTAELGTIVESLCCSTIDSEKARELRAVLYGLAALVKVHFAKEEEVYLPILDAGLSEAEGRKLFEAMEAAASVLV